MPLLLGQIISILSMQIFCPKTWAPRVVLEKQITNNYSQIQIQHMAKIFSAEKSCEKGDENMKNTL
jgi:hypothetical protein